LAGTKITRIAISIRSPKFPAATRFYYAKFAVVDVNNRQAGFGEFLFGYYVSSGVSGWRLLSGPGSDQVGCDVADAVFHGFKRVVLKDLRINCR
jgi:hypothetical protein